MTFTVDCSTDLGHGPSFRLKEDGTWRALEKQDTQIQAGDLVFVDKPDDAGCCAKSIDSVAFGGATYDARNELGITLGHTKKVASVFPRIHRSQRPRRFSTDEVRKAIAGGDDSHRNVIVVDINGFVRLLDLSGDQHMGFQSDPNIAAAYSIFQAGNEYIGADAANDADHVKEVYLGLMVDWIDHLSTGKMNRHDEDFGPLSESSLLKQLDDVTKHLS